MLSVSGKSSLNRISIIPVFLLFLYLVISDVCYSQNYAEYVNPFIGTMSGGNTFPGAVVPWGMVSVSPHNNLNAASGYVYNPNMSTNPSFISGFGHTHISGPGCPDFGSAVLMPTTGEIELDEVDFRSFYDSEEAKPGYYKTMLVKYQIKAEMTATTRTGISRYTFPARNGDANIMINASSNLSPRRKRGKIKNISNTEVEGWNMSGEFCLGGNEQITYFVAQFSKPADSYGTWNAGQISSAIEESGNDVGAFFKFTTSADEAIFVKVGISYVSIENARLNLQVEQIINNKGFEEIKTEAFNAWNKALSRITVEGGTEDQKTIFYTALYHMLIHPNVFNDVNGAYPAMGHGEIKSAEGFTRYTLYSLWDTYRTVHPLLTLVYPEKQLDMVKSIIAIYEEGGWLPKWELASGDIFGMVGDPAALVIVDTYLKGVTQFDTKTAYEAMIKSATQTPNRIRPGLRAYLNYEYIPMDDKMGEFVWGAVSTTLEYNLADWTIAQLAKAWGRQSDYFEYMRRAGFYKNLFDSTTGFLRPKNADGSWYEPFDPSALNGELGWEGSGGPGYVEGNAWQYTFFVPHDVYGLRDLFGSDEAFVEKLQETFDNGQFGLWNEPDFAYPYLFTYIEGEEWRTQKEVRASLKKYFGTGPGGLPGNDDAGTTSGWYVFSAMGFYPDCPGSIRYSIGSPIFDRVTITLNKNFYPGEKFVIQANNNSDENIYIQSVSLNGERYSKPYLNHIDIISGGTITLEMGSAIPTGLYDQGLNDQPKNFNLEQNYPNPLNPKTKLSYTIPRAGLVTLQVYDVLGREVDALVSKDQTAGTYNVSYNTAGLSSGVYFCVLRMDSRVEMKKMVVVKK